MTSLPKEKKEKTPKKTESFDDFRNRVMLVCARELEPPNAAPISSAVKRIELYQTNPAKNTDKVYRLEIVMNATSLGPSKVNTYHVLFAYGRRGSTLKEGRKTDQPVSLYEAERIYNKFYKEKKDEGYTENISGGI